MNTKSILRKAFYSSAIARRLIGFASVFTGRSTPLDLSHFAAYQDRRASGPLQQPEALLLFSIVKSIVPKTIVEFGFSHGHSAFNFLQAMDTDAKLYSFDISDESARIADAEFPKDPRFRFLHKSQTDFCPSDIANRAIELVFFDASHDLRCNQQTFELIRSALTHDALICIHDTGLWSKEYFLGEHLAYAHAQGDKHWIDGTKYAHQNDERIFVNWILETYPDFQSVHFHSSRVLRHGLSILQRARTLVTAEPHTN